MRQQNKSGILFSVIVAGTFSAAGIARGSTLFTTASDWTVYNSAISSTAGTNNGWSGQSGLTTADLSDTPTADLDGNLINGLGNINTATGVSAAGAPGGAGGLQITESGGGFMVVNSPEEANVPYGNTGGATQTPNKPFFSALANSSPQYLAVDFSFNSSAGLAASTYIQPEFTVNDSVDGYDQLGTVNIPDRSPTGPTPRIVGSTTNGQVIYDGINAAGNPQYTLLEVDPFSGPTPTLTLAAGDDYSYFQLLITLNSDYSGVFDVDNIRVQAVPEPASLGLLGLAAPALLLRRRQ